MQRLGHAGRVDRNQAEIADVFRSLGCSVRSIAPLGDGIPDLLVGCEGLNLIVEVKNGNAKLTADEEKFFLTWEGWVSIVRSGDDARDLVRRVREGRSGGAKKVAVGE